MSLHFINIKEEYFKQGKFWKYMPISNALRTLDNGLWFAKPSCWEDPFEKRFYEKDIYKGNEIIQNPFKDKALCCCITEEGKSEAPWNIYGRGETGVCFQFEGEKFLRALKKIAEKDEVYVGKAIYQDTETIEGKISENKELEWNEDGSPIDFNYHNREHLARLYLLKRTYFSYEKELRIIILPKQNISAKGKAYKFQERKYPSKDKRKRISFDIFSTLMFAPKCDRKIFNYFKESLPQIYAIDEIKTKIGNRSRIQCSRLYDAQSKKEKIRL